MDVLVRNNDVEVNNKHLHLTNRELDLFVFLNDVGVVVSRSDMLNIVWGSNYYNPKNVDMTIYRIRKKFSDVVPGFDPFISVRKFGYKISDNINVEIRS